MTTLESTFARRLAALLLAALFLLQSAAQAGSGCLSWVVRGRCCCESSVLPSCCGAPAESAVPRPAPSGPLAERASGCRCSLAPLPPTNSVEITASTRAETGASDGFSAWIALGAPLIATYAVPIEPSPPAVVPRSAQSPPRVPGTFAALRLVTRGVSTFLSDVGFSHR